MSLHEYIANVIANSPEQRISFSEFMRLALYTPQLGYYCQDKLPIGKEGDFVTAPEISSLFSQCLARQIQAILQQLSTKDILEFGAGLGTLACDLLLYLEKENTLPTHYFILELSAPLKQAQYQQLQQRCPHLLSRVVWLEELPQALTGIILANEVLDAMPVDIIRLYDTHHEQAYVLYEEPHFKWHYQTISNPLLQQQAKQIAATLNCDVLKKGYVTEVNSYIVPWLHSVSDSLKNGVALIIDYGFLNTEYYHADRSQGTLMCHYQHQAHSNPLIHVGEQDITAHVDFSAVMEAATKAGFTITGYTTQAHFLLSLGLLEQISHTTDTLEHYRLAQQIKYLTLPSEMGELFKVLALSKNYDLALQGFNRLY